MLSPTSRALARLPLALLVALCLSPFPRAQTPLHAQFALQAGVNYFGNHSAAGIGDVDGDGVPDYAVGARGSDPDPGYVAVYSGATGDLLVVLTGNGGSDGFGRSVAGVGDVNGDQVPDLLVGADEDDTYGINRGVAQVISGADWSVLREHTGTASSFGLNVATLGDANRDGVSEYLVCEAWHSVYCYDGATGLLLWRYQGGFWDAVRASPTVGDANGDGVADALIGAPTVPLSRPLTPYVLVLDGLTGNVIHRIDGTKSTSFGTSVSWIGDVSGDGSSEFAVGIPWSGAGSHDLVVYDGASGASRYGLHETVALGNYVCGMGDQNGDGIPDFAADDGAQAMLYSGVDGSLIHPYDTTPMVVYVGATQWLAPAGDLDGDGAQELINSTYSLSGAARGAVVVFSSSAYPFEDLGFALGGGRGDPALVGESPLTRGSVLRFELSNASVGTPAFAVLGLSAIHLPFGGGTLVPWPDLVLGGLSTSGQGRHQLWVPLPPGIPGQTELYLQYRILDRSGPAGLTASNAVKGIFP